MPSIEQDPFHDQEIYGLYRSSHPACKAEFLSQPKNEVVFKPSVAQECHLCHRHHSFNFDRSINGGTPSARKQLMEMAARHNWQTDVTIPDK